MILILLLLAAIFGYEDAMSPRITRTIDVIRDRLAEGPYVKRYTADDGLGGTEGAFVACSFWLVEALARNGRTDEARALMEQVLPLGNDLGLFPEEIHPGTGEFLGNFPQALSHLALISAAKAIEGSTG